MLLKSMRGYSFGGKFYLCLKLTKMVAECGELEAIRRVLVSIY